MAVYNYGKGIGKTDDSSKKFQMDCLAFGANEEERKGKGIDVEGVYYSKDIDIKGNVCSEEYKYYIIEYLKDESSIKLNTPQPVNDRDRCPSDFSPWKSNPNRYKFNWRKFLALYKLTLNLDGQLVLVNYSDGYVMDDGRRIKASDDFKDQVRLMYVSHIDLELIEKFKTMDYQELRAFKEPYIFFDSEYYTRREYSQNWFIKLNQYADLPF